MDEQPQAKKWYKSKTNGFGMGIGTFGLILLTVPEVKDFIASLPIEYQGIATLFIAGAVMWLRSVTSEPVTR